MDIRAVGDQIIVKREIGEEKSAGGIILQAKPANEVLKGVVIAVGTKSDPDLQVGAKVLFTKWGEEHKIDGQPCVILRSDDIVGFYE